MKGVAVYVTTARVSGSPTEVASAAESLALLAAELPQLDDVRLILLETGDLLDEPLSAIGIKPRLCSSLGHYRGIHTIRQLLDYSEESLYHPYKVGKPSVTHIKECLESVGLRLRTKNPVSK